MGFQLQNYGILQQLGIIPPSPDLPPVTDYVAYYGDKVNNGVDRNTLANGTAITQWDDQSSNNYHLTASTVNTATITYDATFNSIKLVGVHPNNASLNITPPIITGSNVKTIFNVVRFNITNSQYPHFFGTWATQGELLDSYGQAFENSGSRNNFQSQKLAGDYLFTSVQSGTTAGSVNYKINGLDETLTRISPSLPINIDPAGYFCVGSYYDNSTPFVSRNDTDFREVIIYDRALSAQEIEETELYLFNKYFTTKLPVSGATAHYGDAVNGLVDRKSLANGAAITQWTDLSGNGNDATGFGNLNYNNIEDSIKFDGAADYFTYNDFEFRTALGSTIFLVYKKDATAVSYANLLGRLDYNIQFRTNNVDNLVQFTGIGGTAAAVAATNEDIGIAVHHYDGSDEAFMRWNAAQGTTVTGVVTSTDFLSSIGVRGATPTDYYKGDFYEAIFYDRALTQQEIEDTEQYLLNKYFNLVAQYKFTNDTNESTPDNDYPLLLISGGTNDVANPNESLTTFRISGDTAFNVGGSDIAGTGLTNQNIINDGGFSYADDAVLMFWMNIDSFPNYQNPITFMQSKKMWRIYITNDPTKNIVAQRYDGGISNTITASVTNPNVGQWYHIAMRINGSTMELFVDGVSQGTIGLTGNNNNANIGSFDAIDGLNIGMYKFSATAGGSMNDRFDGKVDDVRFYKNGLSASIIQGIFDSGRQ